MDNETKKFRITLLRFMLFGSLIFSQNFTWKLLELIPNINTVFFPNSHALYQSGAGILYIFTAIFTTSDDEVLRSYLDEHPLFKVFLEKTIQVIYNIFFSIVTLLMSISVIFGSTKDTIDANTLEMKQQIAKSKQDFNSPILEVRIYMGLACGNFLIILFTAPLPHDVISIIADILSLGAGLVSCAFVLYNAKHQLQNTQHPFFSNGTNNPEQNTTP